ncbi:MAG: hypothetical protein U0166_17825 [Acidobacteriota bacterium]
MTRRRTSAWLIVALLGLGGLWPRHTHELWEIDLAPHDTIAGAQIVHSDESCGTAHHLHPVRADGHQACPACLAIAVNAAAVDDDLPELGRLTAATPTVSSGKGDASSADRLHADGRAPPTPGNA